MLARFRTFFARHRDHQTRVDWNHAQAMVAVATHRGDMRALGQARARLKEAVLARLDFETSRGGRA